MNQILAIQKRAQLPIYHFFHDKRPLEKPSCRPVPLKLHTMIIDYVDVGHSKSSPSLSLTMPNSLFSPCCSGNHGDVSFLWVLTDTVSGTIDMAFSK